MLDLNEFLKNRYLMDYLLLNDDYQYECEYFIWYEMEKYNLKDFHDNISDDAELIKKLLQLSTGFSLTKTFQVNYSENPIKENFIIHAKFTRLSYREFHLN